MQHPPAYRRVAASLREQIASGELAPGDRLPSETEMTMSLGVSRITIRHALAVLAAEGLVETRHGAGTFVSHPPMPFQLYHLASFIEIVRSRGLEPTSRVLSFEVSTPPQEVQDWLGGAPAYVLERLRLIDGEVSCHDVTWLPAGIGSRIPVDALERRSLYDVYESELGLQVVAASQRVSALGAPSGLARQLGVARGAPLLAVERVTHGTDESVLDWQRRSYIGDRFRLELELQRTGGGAL
ncbi:MAG: GntR family transcriptional regulator [Candidatus Dormibacteraceae bacterium]